jgi:hypothetical protein
VMVDLYSPTGEKRSALGLIDTGADVTCVLRDAIPKGAVLTRSSNQLTHALGGSMTSGRQMETVLGLTIDGLVCPDIAPYVFDNLSCPVILGIDWLRKACATFFLSENVLLESVSIVGKLNGIIERKTIHSATKGNSPLASVSAVGQASPAS